MPTVANRSDCVRGAVSAFRYCAFGVFRKSVRLAVLTLLLVYHRAGFGVRYTGIQCDSKKYSVIVILKVS